MNCYHFVSPRTYRHNVLHLKDREGEWKIGKKWDYVNSIRCIFEIYLILINVVWLLALVSRRYTRTHTHAHTHTHANNVKLIFISILRQTFTQFISQHPEQKTTIVLLWYILRFITNRVSFPYHRSVRSSYHLPKQNKGKRRKKKLRIYYAASESSRIDEICIDKHKISIN